MQITSKIKDTLYSGKDFWENNMINWFGEEQIDKWKKYIQLSKENVIKTTKWRGNIKI